MSVSSGQGVRRTFASKSVCKVSTLQIGQAQSSGAVVRVEVAVPGLSVLTSLMVSVDVKLY